MQETKNNKIIRRFILCQLILGALILLLATLLFFSFSEPPEFTGTALYIGIVLSILAMIIILVLTDRKVLSLIRQKLQDLEEEDTERAERAERGREVLSSISHDLKTPLTAIKGYSRGILDGVAGTPERLNKYVTTILNKADDMSELVDELSFFSQIYQKGLTYDLQEIAVNDYFCSCLSDLILDLEMKKISLIYRYEADEELQIQIDAEKVKRVIHNIIGNASKYIQRERGIVYVNIKENETELIVRISDNGQGITADELPYIFDRFYRTDSSRNSKTGGSGLGLAIAKKIIEDHGGRIWAESEVDKGTAISFSFLKQNDN